MRYYSPKVVINNEGLIDSNSENGLIIGIKFCMKFNDIKLFLNNTLLKQILSSNAVRKFIVNECSSTITSNEESIKETLKKTCIMKKPVTKINFIGKYFYVKVYAGIDSNIEECISSIKRAVTNEKTREEILKGE